MPNAVPFIEMIELVRQRDRIASAQLVREVEPFLLRTVRRYLTSPLYCRLFDPEDICQMVLARLFARLAAGCFDLTTLEQLLALVKRMARNQILDERRRLHAVRRSGNRQMYGREAETHLRQTASSVRMPCHIVADSEMIEELTNRLTFTERLIADRRCNGMEWTAIAEEMGSSAEAVRKKLMRACKRVTSELRMYELLTA